MSKEHYFCAKCAKITGKIGVAIPPNYIADTDSQTGKKTNQFSEALANSLIDCIKCQTCGHSWTHPTIKPNARPIFYFIKSVNDKPIDPNNKL